MPSTNHLQLSKFLSLVLRHQPEKIGITLDEHGWADVNQLIHQINNHHVKFDRQMLEEIVSADSKKRYAFNDAGDKIRASQGHSIDVDLGYTDQQPPAFLYHGTGQQSVASIQSKGIEKGKRQHVHLSMDIETATKVGQRHGTPYIFKVLSKEMYLHNFKFYLSANGVWLTEFIPPQYLIEL